MSAKAKSEEEPVPEAEKTPFEAGEWVDATAEQEHPTIGLLIWYSVPGQEPAVRLGRWDGQTYNEEATGRASLDGEVSGFKELMSEAPSDPGIALPEPPPEPEPLQEPAKADAS